MENEFDLIVIGGGVLGTFHAHHALEKGLKVAILEKDKAPQSATTRNFGQVVPSGMDTKWQNYGRESLKIYKQLQERFDITARQNGSVYFASNEEEMTLIEELYQINKNNGYQSVLLTKEECLAKYSGLRSDYVKAGLFFPEEITVEPRTMIHRLQAYLVQEKNLKLLTYHQVNHCAVQNGKVEVQTSLGNIFKAQHVIICNGSEFKTLYPELFEQSDLEVTKLQMLQTVPQPSEYVLPGSILTGLSIRRYESFYECPSFKEIKAKENADTPEKKWGVHILFKQAADGSVIIGDSHEYADVKDIDDLGYDIREDINAFMLTEARKIVDLPTYEIQRQWFGIYSQCKNHDVFEHTIDGQIHIVTGIGGKGMTGSAGYSKENINRILM
ncbi:TPA: TIGR03364 family FAD-dependent oxidoreductase [Elizabethkingia meningoseptica]|uniref:TIGR03364 family FAD-dependent oxidoreductase n=1 Tax=Elizabethkingia meningoseptica TaxID=238 RepID=UPI0022F1CF03|nr:TIGR03364 family FAD-dependent oxidoreductase [Elizabethkingia meningoseptica]EJK5328280.1 TIGR03364 family FAD-dependent oxidoreductase [Elizabethkingia meningoseptica]WBS76140.1 TIGR03364 family FAD-dependent oxidoreductase [Elizabethkingia meningoseptica]HAY3561987.1 TIGR03364 family FAD-dependent oxidoreductase [Elizabethkingia meningoseptica]